MGPGSDGSLILEGRNCPGRPPGDAELLAGAWPPYPDTLPVCHLKGCPCLAVTHHVSLHLSPHSVTQCLSVNLSYSKHLSVSLSISQHPFSADCRLQPSLHMGHNSAKSPGMYVNVTYSPPPQSIKSFTVDVACQSEALIN